MWLWPTSKVSAHLPPATDPWHLSDSFLLPAFSSVFPNYLNSALSTYQRSFFIHLSRKAAYRQKDLPHHWFNERKQK